MVSPLRHKMEPHFKCYNENKHRMQWKVSKYPFKDKMCIKNEINENNKTMGLYYIMNSA